MIKNVAYFPLQCALNSGPVMSAMLDSLAARGITTQENSMHSDAVIIWSALFHGRMAKNRQVYEHYRRENKPVIIVEIGALYRGNTWKIAVNNITAQGYYGHKDNLDWDRPRKLKISLAQQTGPKPHVILALQHSRSLQVEHIADMTEWVRTTLGVLRANTDRHIVIRSHPRCRTPLFSLPPGVSIEQPKKIENTYDSFDMHFDCHAVVNYNSGPGIQAAIAGVRPIVDSTSLAEPVSMGFADIEQPYLIDRDQWLTEICHTEYTVEEIRAGIWLNRLENALTT